MVGVVAQPRLSDGPTSLFVPMAYKILHVVQEYRHRPEFVQLFGVNVAVCVPCHHRLVSRTQPLEEAIKKVLHDTKAAASGLTSDVIETILADVALACLCAWLCWLTSRRSLSAWRG